MSKIRIIGVVMVVLVISLILANTGMAESLFNSEPSEEVYSAIGKSNLPEVTQSEKEQAVEIALNDARIQELLEDKEFVIAPEGRIGLWHAEPELGGIKLGVAFEIDFDKAYFLAYDWPYVDWRDDEKSAIVQKTRHFEGDIRGLIVLVDMRDGEGKVATIIPK
jgi:hypothetical protein